VEWSVGGGASGRLAVCPPTNHASAFVAPNEILICCGYAQSECLRTSTDAAASAREYPYIVVVWYGTTHIYIYIWQRSGGNG